MKIAIASGKGGTGKTTLSTNLAAFLAEDSDVALIDLDVEEPNSGLFVSGDLTDEENKFKQIPQWKAVGCSLCGTCQEVCNFHAVIKLADQVMVFPELCHSCYACSELCPESALPMVPQKMGKLKHQKNKGLHFIESRLDIGQEQAVPLISQTHKYVEQNIPADWLRIYDAPPGTSCPVIEATKETDFIILITEPTPFGLHDLKLAIDTMRLLQKPFGVVINRHGIGNEAVDDYCKAENIPVLARIPDDRRIAELYAQGKLIYPEFPRVKQELQKLRDYILELDRGGLA